MAKRKVIVTAKRQVKTYNIMLDASYSTLYKAEEHSKGLFYQIMASLTFTAFALEAYLNYLGKTLFKKWDYFERLSPNQKLDIITEKLEVKKEDGKRPFQTIIDLFKFRNDIAHGKSVFLKSGPEEKYIDDNDDIKLETKWEKYCKLKNAKRAMEDVQKIITLLHEKAGRKDPLWGHGITETLLVAPQDKDIH